MSQARKESPLKTGLKLPEPHLAQTAVLSSNQDFQIFLDAPQAPQTQYKPEFLRFRSSVG